MARKLPTPPKEFDPAPAKKLIEDIRRNHSLALELPYREYWLRLGEFVTRFAVVERRLQAALRHYAGVSNKIGQAAFGGVRVKPAIDAINRLLEVRDLPRVKARLKGPFAQLGLINDVRNSIFHWGSHFIDEDAFLVTNRYLVHSETRARDMLVTPDMLHQMTGDLFKINHHISLEIEKRKMPRRVYRHPFRMILNDTWQYKPLPPIPPAKAPRLTHRGLPRQRRASQG